MTASRSPALAEVLSAVIGHRLAGARVCMPGIVRAYDSAKQTADVKPAVQESYAADGGEVVNDLPVIPSVPVCFPRAGAWSITFPLAVGDHVVLMFTDRSLDRFRALGGVQDPRDLRSHDLSDAVAFPASLVPDADVITPAPPDHLVLRGPVNSVHLRSDGTIALGTENPADSAATATKVGAQLDALAAAFDAWVPVPNDGGAVLKTLLTALRGTGWPASTASSVVKVSP